MTKNIPPSEVSLRMACHVTRSGRGTSQGLALPNNHSELAALTNNVDPDTATTSETSPPLKRVTIIRAANPSRLPAADQALLLATSWYAPYTFVAMESGKFKTKIRNAAATA